MATLPNYFLDNGAALPTNPFQSALTEGMRFGATIQDFQAAQQQRQQQQQDRELKLQAQQRAQDQQAELQTLLSNPTPASTKDLLRMSALLPKDQSASVMAVYDKLTTKEQQSKIKQSGQIYASMKTGNLDVTKSLLQQQADGFRNIGNEEEAKAAETYIKMLDINPSGAQNTVGLMIAALPGGKEALENIDKTLGTTRAEELQPSALRKADAEATKAKVESDYAEKEILSRLKQSAAATGASNASIARSMAEVKNLNTTGKMLRLDWEAASQGLVMPSKRTEGGKPAPTEDERKTAVNLAQATNAYKNMLNAMYTKEGKKTGAEKPESIESIPFYIGSALGGITRSTKREQFNQSASSLAEALLRVSTGAGITKDEAEQKIKEITPLYTDDQATRDQKLASIPEYLKAIQVRAGRALPEDYKIPQVPTEQSRNVTVDY